MSLIIANPIGKLANGRHLVLFPSRWDWAGNFHPFSYYPYELAYLSTLLKREFPSAPIRMIDLNHEQLNPRQSFERLQALGPQLLVTECSALTYPAMTQVMLNLKRNGLEAAFLCGPYGTTNTVEAKHDGWDQVFSGEFEVNVLRTIQGLERTSHLVQLDYLPFPEDEDISRINYSECSNLYPGMVQVYPTRGCPMGCTFCVVPMYYGGHGKSHQSHRVRNVEAVCEEIRYLAEKYPAFSGAFFNDEAHNANVEWLDKLALALIDHGLNRYHYDAMCVYWGWTEERIQLLARAGYCYLRVGIESLSPEVGRAIHKTVFPDKLKCFMQWCKDAGILVYGTSQIGAPGSTRDSDMATLDGLWELKDAGLLHKWQHSISTPQPGTPFYQQVKDAGYLITEDTERFNGVESVISWPHYPAEEINRVNREHHIREAQYAAR